MIYLDNAATTQMDDNVIESMMQIMTKQYGNASSLHVLGRGAKKHIEEARDIIASCINASPNEIIFTSGGTESDNLAIRGMMENHLGNKGLVASFEHKAVLNAVDVLNQKGYIFEKIPVSNDGMVLVDDLKNMLDDNVKMVSIMMVNNEVGTIQPIKELATVIHSLNSKCVFHTDAVQAIGHIPIDVQDMQIDMLSASAHKFNGPKGVGFLYVRNGLLLHPIISGGSQEFGRRAGTENVAAIVGMAQALKNNIDLIKVNEEYVKAMRMYFLELLSKKGVHYELNGDKEHVIASCINICFPGIDAEALMNVLDMNGICVSLGSACNSKEKERSHVLTAMNFSFDKIDSSMRFSLSKKNDKEELEIVAQVIANYCMKFQMV